MIESVDRATTFGVILEFPATSMRHTVISLLGFAAAFSVANIAVAQEPPMARDETEAHPRTYLNLRVGAASTSRSGRPEICAEVAPFTFVSLEACGTGSGLLHRDPAPEVAHFRLPFTPVRLHLSETSLAFRIAPGFAELQIDTDAPGFEFGELSDDRPVETAGPELTSSAQWVVPIGLGIEFVMNLDLGTAWFPHAPELVVPLPVWQPFVEISAGIGF